MIHTSSKRLIIVPYLLPPGEVNLESPGVKRDIAAVVRAVPTDFAPDVVFGPENPVTRLLRDRLGVAHARIIPVEHDQLPSTEFEDKLRYLTNETAVLAFINVLKSPSYISQLGYKADPRKTERCVLSAVYPSEWSSFSLEQCLPGESTAFNQVTPATRLFGAADFTRFSADELARGGEQSR